MDIDAVERHLRHSPEDYTHVLRVALAAVRRPEQERENVLDGPMADDLPLRDSEDQLSHAFPTLPFQSTTTTTTTHVEEGTSSTPTPFPTLLLPSAASFFFLSHARPLPLLLPLQWEAHVAPLMECLIRVAHALPLQEAVLAWSLVHTSMQKDLLHRYGAASASMTPPHTDRHRNTLPRPSPATAADRPSAASSSGSSTRSHALRPLPTERVLYWKLQQLQDVLRSRFLLLPSSSSYKKDKPSGHLSIASGKSASLSPSVSKKLSGAEWALLQWLSSQEQQDLS